MDPTRPSQSDLVTDPPADELVESAYQVDSSSVKKYWHWMNLADLSHVLMLLRQDLIPRGQGRRLMETLLKWEELPDDRLPENPETGDMYRNREALLEEQAPGAAGWLSLGRPRREATTLAFLLMVRSRWIQLSNSLLGLSRHLIERASKHARTLLPDYTYHQRAQPTTLGHYLLGFFYPLKRDHERIRQAFHRINRCPAGKGSTNGSRLNLDRLYISDILGFEAPVSHARDAMWQPDLPVEVMGVVHSVAINMDRLAEDLQIWSTQEFNFVELSDSTSRPSVIMPNKKNPYSLSFVRGVANKVHGTYAGVSSAQRTGSGQVDNRLFPYQSVVESLDLVRSTVDLMARVVQTITVNTSAMKQAVEDSFLAATDLAEFLTRECGISYGTAHRVVARAVSRANSLDDSDPSSLPKFIRDSYRELTGESLDVSPEELEEIKDPESVVRSRETLGGASPGSMTDLLEEATKWVEDQTDWSRGLEEDLDDAESRVLETAATRKETQGTK